MPKADRRRESGDLVLTVDALTEEYIGYREVTPGSMIVSSSEMLGKRLGDVVPSIADMFHEAMWAAGRDHSTIRLAYALRGHNRIAHVSVLKGKALLHISAVGLVATPSTAVG